MGSRSTKLLRHVGVLPVIPVLLALLLFISGCVSTTGEGSLQDALCRSWEETKSPETPSIQPQPALPVRSNGLLTVSVPLAETVSWQIFVDGVLMIDGSGSINGTPIALEEGIANLEIKASNVIKPTEKELEIRPKLSECSSLVVEAQPLVHELTVDLTGPELVSPSIESEQLQVVVSGKVIDNDGGGVCCGRILGTDKTFTINSTNGNTAAIAYGFEVVVSREELGYPSSITIELFDSLANPSRWELGVPLPESFWKQVAENGSTVQIVELPGWHPYDVSSAGLLKPFTGWERGTYWVLDGNNQEPLVLREPTEWTIMYVGARFLIIVVCIVLVFTFTAPLRNLAKRLELLIAKIQEQT